MKKYLLYCVAAVIVIYLIAAFVLLQLNPIWWDKLSRTIVAICWVFAAIVIISHKVIVNDGD